MIYRGNVIEIKEDSLVVMLDDCTFENVKKFKGLEEGMEIYFEERDIIRKSNVNLKSIALIAASIFLFIVTTFYGVDFWNTNYRAIALVSVDINPSVQIKLSKDHSVINAKALNEDAKKLQLNELKSLPIDKALDQLVNMAKTEGYIKEIEENYVLVTAVNLRENEQTEKVLTDLIEVGKQQIEASAIEEGHQIEVISIKSDKETLKEAKKENISVGKKELNKDADIKQEDHLREKIKLNKVKNDEKLKELEKEAKELEQKLKETQKSNNKDNDNKKDNEIIKEEKDRLKEAEKQKKDEIKEITKQGKDKIKEDAKDKKDIEKDLKEQEKNKEKEAKELDKIKKR